MKALRIVLTQNKAHYRKEETITNKMTYPLPPFSTVIGALHNACGFREYHPMDISIQGKFASMAKQAYTDHCFLNSVMDDRGILVKLKSSNFQSIAFEKVASAMKSQGNSFRKDITIQVHNKELIKEYRELKNLNDELGLFKKNQMKNLKEIFKKRKKSITLKKKKFDKKSNEFKKLANREKEIKNKENLMNEKFKEFENENYTKKVSKYQSLTTSLKFYEILIDVELVIHIKADDEILEKIKDNIYNLKSIGRSEDFVDVTECELVELDKEIEGSIKSKYSAYLNYENVKNENVFFQRKKSGIPANGTKYYINKVYNLIEGQRKFEKKKVLYTSNYRIDEDSENIYADGKYIVDFN